MANEIQFAQLNQAVEALDGRLIGIEQGINTILHSLEGLGRGMTQVHAKVEELPQQLADTVAGSADSPPTTPYPGPASPNPNFPATNTPNPPDPTKPVSDAALGTGDATTGNTETVATQTIGKAKAS